MSWRSLTYFALAFCVSMANLAANAGGPMWPTVYRDPDGECGYVPEDTEAGLSVDQVVAVSSAPVIVAAGLVVLAVAITRGRARLGRVTVRALAGVLLLTGGFGTVLFVVNLLTHSDCYYGLGGDLGELVYYLAPAVPPAVAATAMVLASAPEDRSVGPRG
ncbi:hypothetical protein FDA94_31925 [Herbidospora galbida]|uniref:Uncharacterized protein n=1 Tax=Herbidospora galbida TaxID=2575442 RepID=A0A4U3M7K7_9ACTN|nr:hypothetical protein [Herbidospora galbida]TKK83974.1 hypothetical protein FDA94_31925 [Herbidospora galbida]